MELSNNLEGCISCERISAYNAVRDGGFSVRIQSSTVLEVGSRHVWVITVRKAAVESIKLLGAVLCGITLVLLVLVGVEAGLLNLLVLTVVVFVAVAAQTRK